jgi:hypothetical protein
VFLTVASVAGADSFVERDELPPELAAVVSVAAADSLRARVRDVERVDVSEAAAASVSARELDSARLAASVAGADSAIARARLV